MRRRRIVTATILVTLQLSVISWALPTTPDEAELVVTGWLKGDPQPLGMAVGRNIAGTETYMNDEGEPMYYIVNLDPSGFVIVAADDLVEPVVGFADDGRFDPSLDNPLGALVTNDLTSRMEAVKSPFQLLATVDDVPLTDTQKKWSRLIGIGAAPEGGFTSLALSTVSDVRVAPLIQSHWDQGRACSSYCYNYYTPNHYPSGCVATAMAQLIRFYRYPSEPNDSAVSSLSGRRGFTIKVDGDESTAYLKGGDSNGGPYMWHLMELTPDCSTALARRQAIGALCYDTGISANMEYTRDGSSANLYYARESLLSTFQYSNAISGWYYDYPTKTFLNLGSKLTNMVNPNLDAGHPVILGLTGPPGGHAVLADGYGYNFSTLYYHLNMGWSGNHDAYYNLPTIDSNPSFNVVDECVYNIFTSREGEIISGRITDAYGNPVSGAAVTATENTISRFTEIFEDVTDGKGIYAIEGLDSNTRYTLNVSKAGYHFEIKEVTTGRSFDGGSVAGNKWGIDFQNTVPVNVFEDTFSTWSLDTTRWTETDGPVFVSDRGIGEPTTPYSLELGATISGRGSVSSKTIDLSDFSNATITYHHQRTGGGTSPQDGGHTGLDVSYWNGSTWMTLNQLSGSTPDMTTYEMMSISLPPEALRADFKFRIARCWDSTNPITITRRSWNGGDWFIDDVRIEAW